MTRPEPLKNRLPKHPILDFDWKRNIVHFKYNGKTIEAYEGETIASALYASGVRTFSYSFKYSRPRGLFCATGKCCSCMMRVNGVPNVRTCVTRIHDGMVVQSQKYRPFFGLGRLALPFFRRFSGTRILPVGFHYRRFTKPRIIRKMFYWGMGMFAGMGKYPDYEKNESIIKRKPLPTLEKEIVVIGGGPAGLQAALHAAQAGAQVTLIDENFVLGGQLVKQTHEFIESTRPEGVKRGIEIAREMAKAIQTNENIEIMLESQVVGIYEDNLLGVAIDKEFDQKFIKMKAQKVIVATGAYERFLSFENNDLPGVYGAVAVQTLMNRHGINPGRKALIVGSGNVGLILADQLMQGGVQVQAIVEVLPHIGGYPVYKSKVAQFEIPIYTTHSIKRAIGRKRVKGAIIHQVDKNGQKVPGTSKRIKCDMICLSVGQKPAFELLAQANAELIFIPELGGHVPLRNEYLETTVAGLYAVGDVSGIEEVNAAIMEGRVAGISAAMALGKIPAETTQILEETLRNLKELRSAPFREKIRVGLVKAQIED
ncbi:MAG: FAD-dependent oxidoreductase [Candidatus Hodarchaeota archaeon]